MPHEPDSPERTAAAQVGAGSGHRAWWRDDDWLAVFVAAGLLAAALAGWRPPLPALGWKTAADLPGLLTPANWWGLAIVSAAVLLPATIAAAVAGRGRIIPAAAGTAVILALGWVATILAAGAPVKKLGIEYVIFALGLGMLWRAFLPVPEWLAGAVRTEFLIKVGIVILGAGILFPDLLKAGVPGLVQAALVIPLVWQATFLLGRRLRVDDEFNVMVSSAVSICGVSAAIAACGAIQGDKRKLSYVTSVVLLCAVPMMLVMPWVARWLGLPPAVAGAWLGGTLDTTGSVLAATEMLGTEASKTGAVVKLSQNVFIGLAALLISVWWTMRPGAGAPSAGESRWRIVWERFPKFVLGFVAASLVFSFLAPAGVAAALDKPLKGLREAWFTAAFVCIGLETRFTELLGTGGGRPALAFIGGQAVNIAWTLLLAWLLFGGMAAG
jgi:uncharacterized membrane protein YadS